MSINLSKKINLIIDELNWTYKSMSYPYEVVNNQYLINNNYFDIPETVYYQLSITLEFIRNSSVDELIKIINNMTQKFNLPETFAGQFYFKVYQSPISDVFEIRCVSKVIDIGKTLHDEEFNERFWNDN